jgi:hypothetical protein
MIQIIAQTEANFNPPTNLSRTRIAGIVDKFRSDVINIVLEIVAFFSG